MKQMSFVSLANILLSSVEKEDAVDNATQEDIDRYFGQEVIMATSTINIIVICLTILLLYFVSIMRNKQER